MSLDRRGGPGPGLVVFALGLLIGTSLTDAADAADQLPMQYRADFTRGEFDIRDLALSGGHAEELVQAEPAGLRIKIPPNMNKPEGVGIRTRAPIRGDFDISVAFDILRADKPTEGYGIGAQIWLETDTPTQESVTAEWTYTPGKDGTRFISTRILGKPDGQREYRPRSLPANRRSGTLRLVRTGGMVRGSYLEEGTTEQGVPLVPLGTEDVTQIKVQANTGSSDHPVEIRLRSLTIAAEELPGWAGATRTGGTGGTKGQGGIGGGGGGSMTETPSPASPALIRPIAVGAAIVAAVAGLLALCAWLVNRPKAGRPAAPGSLATDADLPAQWDDEPLARLESRAEAFARDHPDAEIFFEPGHCQFTLRNATIDGPCVVWWRVEPGRLKRSGQSWDDVRRQLPKRYRGQYVAGQRDGAWQGWDSTGGTVLVTFRAGERV